MVYNVGCGAGFIIVFVSGFGAWLVYGMVLGVLLGVVLGMVLGGGWV